MTTQNTNDNNTTANKASNEHGITADTGLLLPPLPVVADGDEQAQYSQSLSVGEQSLLLTGESADWGHASDDDRAGVDELNAVLGALSPDALAELKFRAHGLTQVRARKALDELGEVLEDKLVDEFDTCEGSAFPDFETITGIVEGGVDSVAVRHFSCW